MPGRQRPAPALNTDWPAKAAVTNQRKAAVMGTQQPTRKNPENKLCKVINNKKEITKEQKNQKDPKIQSGLTLCILAPSLHVSWAAPGLAGKLGDVPTATSWPRLVLKGGHWTRQTEVRA